MKRTISFGIAAVSAAAVILGTSGAAYAAAPGGAESCPSDSICLYYNSPQYGWGSFEHWSPGSYGDLGQFTFSNWGNGSGYGIRVGGNAASVVNNTATRLTIYNATYSHGTVLDTVPPGYAGVLPSGIANAEWSMYSS